MVRYWVVHTLLHLQPQFLKLADHPRPLRLALYHEPALSGHPAIKGEAEKGKGLRSALTPARPVRRSKPAELDQAGLAFVKAEPELGETFAESLQQSFCVASISAEQDIVIGESNETDVPSRLSPLPLLYPKIETVMQIDVGENRAAHSPNAKGNFCRDGRND